MMTSTMGTIGVSHRGFGFGLGHPNFSMPHNASRFTRRRPRPADEDEMTDNTATGLVRRHGSVARSVSPTMTRGRERDREYTLSSLSQAFAGNPTAQARAHNFIPAGPQAAADWAQALIRIEDRLNFLERASLKHTQGLAGHDEKINANTARCENLNDRMSKVEQMGVDKIDQIVAEAVSDKQTVNN